MYQFICDFGSFAVGAGIITYALYSLLCLIGDGKRERDLNRHLQEHDRKRGGM